MREVVTQYCTINSTVHQTPILLQKPMGLCGSETIKVWCTSRTASWISVKGSAHAKNHKTDGSTCHIKYHKKTNAKYDFFLYALCKYGASHSEVKIHLHAGMLLQIPEIKSHKSWVQQIVS